MESRGRMLVQKARMLVKKARNTRDTRGEKVEEDKNREYTTVKDKTEEDNAEEDKTEDYEIEENKPENRDTRREKVEEDKTREYTTVKDKTEEDNAGEDKTEDYEIEENKPEEDKPEEDKPEEDKPEEDKPDEDKPEENKTEEGLAVEDNTEEDIAEEYKNKEDSTEIDIAEEDKTEEDETEEDKPENNKTEEDIAEEDKPDKEKPEENETEEDIAELDKPEEDKTEEDKPDKEKPEENETEEDIAELGKPEEDKTEEDKPDKENPEENETEEDIAGLDKPEEDKTEEDKAEDGRIILDEMIEVYEMIGVDEMIEVDNMMTDENTTIGTLGEEAGGDMSGQEIENIEVFENGEWEIHKSDSPTKIKVSRISRKKENKKHNVASKNSDSESVDEADDSDRDPDFDIRSEYPKKKFCFKLEEKKKIKTQRTLLENVSENTSSEVNNSSLQNDSISKGKKRKALPLQWLKTKNKILRNAGKAYISYKTRKEIRAKSVHPGCDEKCRLNCSYKITGEEREEIFKMFWGLGDINRQRDFVSRSMSSVTPKYRYSNPESKRSLNSAFYFKRGDEKIRVCKKFFTATLDIPNRFIRTVNEKQSKGFVMEDRRGKHENHKTVDPEIKEGVRRHIASIPRIESHYLRKQTERQYIEGGKTIADLYRDYKADCERNNLPYAHQSMYSHIFNNEFNLSFFVPKKDQCDLCAAYDNADETTKSEMKEKYEIHLLEKNLSRQEKEQDKKNVNENFIVACYDLQATFPVPKGDISLFYYKSKLNCQNFTICELKSKNVHCYTWHEGEGSRGVNELGTCVWEFLKTKCHNCEEIVLYSDNCWGQQKNKYMISLYIYAVETLNIMSLTHKFLIKGHTQNEGDSAHSVIERAVKRSLKSGPVYVPSQYVHIIRCAKKTGTPFYVNEMSHEDFLNIKKIHDQYNFIASKRPSRQGGKEPHRRGKKVKKLTEEQTLSNTDGGNSEEDTENETFMLSKALVIKIEKQNPTLLLYKNSYTDQDFKKHQLHRRKSSQPISTYQLQPLVKSKLPVAEKKKSDLLSLVKSNVIPKFYHSFYENL